RQVQRIGQLSLRQPTLNAERAQAVTDQPADCLSLLRFHYYYWDKYIPIVITKQTVLQYQATG
ncbi:MAG TPA: hypothetical protein VIA18_00425, partial [Polyangia bacterium]|nr:hypothetical protein [Polyangia bacterium]